jgi:DNA processing protein
MPPGASDIRDMLALHLVAGLGPRLTAALLERFGTAGAVLRASSDRLQSVPHIGAKLGAELSAAMQHVDVDAELARLEKSRVRLVMMGTPEYPAALAEIHDPPYLLYVRGKLLEQDAKAIAIVGSRHCTSYGKRIGERLAAGLARAGYTIVSGLARGIDGAAHRATLEAGGRTVAVLAGGLSSIYPPEHTELADEIEKSGALVTESSMEQQPLPGTFPPRNRIISGLSRAVVLVEAAERSGALITARHAGDQGRTVMAVPGPVDQMASGGTNSLIRQGAVLVRSVDDVLEEVQGLFGGGIRETEAVRSSEKGEPVPAAVVGPPPGLDPVQLSLWQFLEGSPRHLDEMVQQLGLSVSQLAGILLGLEMKKVVRRLPGNRYERC